MIPRLTNRIRFLFRTHEQTTFLDFLPKMKFTSDEQLITNIRVIYDKRVSSLRFLGNVGGVLSVFGCHQPHRELPTQKPQMYSCASAMLQHPQGNEDGIKPIQT